MISSRLPVYVDRCVPVFVFVHGGDEMHSECAILFPYIHTDAGKNVGGFLSGPCKYTKRRGPVHERLTVNRI